MARPRKNIIDNPVDTGLIDNDVVIDAPIIDAPLSEETPLENIANDEPKRERKKREKSAPKATKAEKVALASQIQWAHTIVAMVSGIREIELSPDESESLAIAITDVMAYHEILIDPKTAAYLNLAAVAVMIYAPRGYTVYKRRQFEKQSAVVNQKTSEKPSPEHHEENFEVETVGDKIQPPPNQLGDLVEEIFNDDFAELENF